jgi:hypothetical protein
VTFTSEARDGRDGFRFQATGTVTKLIGGIVPGFASDSLAVSPAIAGLQAVASPPGDRTRVSALNGPCPDRWTMGSRGYPSAYPNRPPAERVTTPAAIANLSELIAVTIRTRERGRLQLMTRRPACRSVRPAAEPTAN